jgi:glucose/arabinose dehydrogenase/PKD repeat protein
VAAPCFQSTTLASGLDFPTTVTWAPDGRMFIAEKFGYVRVVKPDGTLPPNPLIDIHDHTVNTGDRGLLGLAASAPVDGQGDIRLYMLYAHGEPTTTTMQIATSTLTWVLVKPDDSIEGGSFNASTGTTVDPTEHTVIGSVTTTPKELSTCAPGSPNCACPSEGSDCIPNEGYTHSIGTVLVDPKDGSLWIGAGDGFNDGAYTEASSAPFHLRSQDPESLAGKVLHVKTDGSGFANSPFCTSSTDTTSNCSKVYADGFRNPFRFTLRQVGGVTQPVVGDVGEGNWEELNDVHRGFDGGWPCYEGNVVAGEPYEASTQCKALGAKYDHAFYLFDHYQGGTTQTGGAIVAGPVYTGTTYPSTYQGEVFNTDYVHGWINFRSLEDSVDALEATHTFLSGNAAGRGTPYVSLQQAPDGDLVVVAIYGDPESPGPASGYVSEVRYAPVDKSPVARATASATCVNTTTTTPTLTFTGDGSGDPDGDLLLSYRWNFGDGASSTEADPKHTYSGTGTYEVHLTVTDSKGNADNAYITLHIGPGDEPPNATITTPKVGDNYLAGRPISLSGGTTTAPPVQMSWEPVLNHSGTHVHVLGDIPTETGDAEFTADEFHGADSHYVLRFIVSKNGCTTTISREMLPQTGRYYLNAISQASEPVTGLPLTFLHTSTPETVPSGTPLTPAYFQVAKNARAKVSAPTTWINGGYTYTFAGWSDGQPQEHEVHPYEYPAHLAEDPQGLTATYNRSNKPPTASIESPLNGSTFVSAQPLTIHGSATDTEDGTIPGEHMTWKITRHANSTETNVPVPNGSTAKFTPDAAGDPNATYTIELTATDSIGAMSSPATIAIHAATSKLTLASAPAGVTLQLASTSAPAPFTTTLPVGDSITVSAPATTVLTGRPYVFTSWSDGGGASHSFPVGSSDSTLTAGYTPDAPPVASIESPLEGWAFVSGQPLTIHGSATDTEDGTIPGEHMTWKITRHANSTETNVPVPNGSTAKFTPDAAGDPNATYTIELTATDSAGLTSALAMITLHAAQPPPQEGGGEPKPPGGGGGLGGIPNPIESIGKVPPPAAPTITLARLKSHPSSLEGTVSDPAGIAEVRIAIRPRRVNGKGCVWWSLKRHRLVRVTQKCSQPSWLKARMRSAKGAVGWSLALGGRLPTGRYVLVVSARDRGGRTSTSFDGNPSGVLVVR